LNDRLERFLNEQFLISDLLKEERRRKTSFAGLNMILQMVIGDHMCYERAETKLIESVKLRMRDA